MSSPQPLWSQRTPMAWPLWGLIQPHHHPIQIPISWAHCPLTRFMPPRTTPALPPTATSPLATLVTLIFWLKPPQNPLHLPPSPRKRQPLLQPAAHLCLQLLGPGSYRQPWQVSAHSKRLRPRPTPSPSCGWWTGRSKTPRSMLTWTMTASSTTASLRWASRTAPALPRSH